MMGPEPETGRILPHFVVLLAAALTVTRGVRHGASSDMYQRIWRDIVGRFGGPLAFCIFLQPIVAAARPASDQTLDQR